MDSFKILQWNINGYKPQKENLQLILNKYDPIAINLQETNFNKKNISRLKNFNLYYKNRKNADHASGGVATYVTKKFKSTYIPLNTNMEAVAVKITLPNETLTICNIYLPNSYQFNIQELYQLLTQIQKPFLLMGDFNSHSFNWGSYKTDMRGKVIEKLLDDPEFMLLNNSEPTHLNSSYNSLSAIDLTISDSSTAHKYKWSTLRDTHGSDHFPILISKESNMTFDKTSFPRWMFDKGNYDLYLELMSKKTEHLLVNDYNLSPIEKIENLTDAILEVAEMTIPKTSGKLRNKQVPWWDNECAKAQKEMRNALSHYKRHPTTNYRIEFKQARAKVRKIFKDKNNSYWNNYKSSITPSTPTGVVWEKLNSMNGYKKKSPIPPIDNGEFIMTSDSEIANAFATLFAKNSSNENYNPEFLNHKNQSNIKIENILELNCESNQTLNAPILPDEIITVLNKAKNSAAGPDEIPNILLKKLPRNTISYLTDIYNEILNLRTFPPKWREALVIPIPKPNKDHTKLQSYRPIALTCTPCKVLEKVINRRIIWHLNCIDFFTPFQSGFRENRSTLDHLAEIESTICDAFITNEHVMTVSLDMEKAYDMVWRDRIVEILLSVGINGNILTFFGNFLKNRSIQVRVRNEMSSKVEIENGVPQGSVLSVTAFLIAINEITSIIPKPIKILLFADDITLLCCGKNIETTQSLMQDSLNKIVEWAVLKGFKFSETKSEVIVFSRHQDREQVNLKLGLYELKQTDDIKILGLIFDRKLTWGKHIKSLKQDCLKRMNVIKSIASTKWGADKDTILMAYKALIRSKIDYGAIIYDSAQPAIKKSLNSIHNLGLRMALGAFKTSPIDSILAEANEPPLEIRRKLLSLTYAARIKVTPNNPVHNTIFNGKKINEHNNAKPNFPKPLYSRILNYLEEFSLEFPNIVTTNDRPDPTWCSPPPKIDFNLTKYSKQDTDPNVFRQLFLELKNTYRDHDEIYTDGSKSTNGSSCAIIFPNKTIQIKLNDMSSIFFCESYALSVAIREIVLTGKNKNIIYTDSKSAIEAISNFKNKDPLINSIKANLISAQNNDIEIVLAWIPSHVNIDGNEKADLAAREGALTTLDPNTPVSLHDLKKFLIKQSKIMWNQKWLENPPQKLHQVRENLLTDYPPKLNNRKNQVVLSRIRIGHTNLTHIHLITKDPQNKCPACDQPASIEHIFKNCRNLQNQRRLAGIKPIFKDNFNNTGQAEKIIKFLNEIKIFNLI